MVIVLIILTVLLWILLWGYLSCCFFMVVELISAIREFNLEDKQTHFKIRILKDYTLFGIHMKYFMGPAMYRQYLYILDQTE